MSLRLSRLPYYERWFIIGLVIGVVVGLADLALYFLNVYVIEDYALGALGIHVPHPGSPASLTYSHLFPAVLALPAIVALASLASWFLATVMRTHEVGSDVAIRAYHRNLRLGINEAPAAIISSSITIGLGGSAGREGPASHAGAVIGQAIANLLGTSPEDRRRALAVGMGSAIGVIFKTPFAGALLAAELLYRRDLEPDVIYPALIASSVGYLIYGSVTGYTPIFGYYTAPFNPLRLPLYLILGLMAGGVGLLYPYAFFAVGRWFSRTFRNSVTRALVGGAMAGVIAVVFPEVTGEGYGWLWQASKLGALPSPLPLWAVLALLPLAKILATSVTLGSGAKGGVFAPGIAIGGFMGLAMGYLFHYLMPSLVPSPMPFMIVGMLATFGVAGSVPLSVTLMVVEMTGGLQLLPAEMIALGAAYLVAYLPGRGALAISIFKEQVTTRADSPAHMAEFSVPLLTRLKVSEARLYRIFVSPTSKASEALATIRSMGLLSLPVVDELNRVLGIVTVTSLASAKPDELVVKYMAHEPGHVRPSSSLYEALELMGRSGSRYAIVEDRGKFVGLLTMDELIDVYTRALKELRQTSEGLASEPP